MYLNLKSVINGILKFWYYEKIAHCAPITITHGMSEWKLLIGVWLFATPWTLAFQAHLSMEFSIWATKASTLCSPNNHWGRRGIWIFVYFNEIVKVIFLKIL